MEKLLELLEQDCTMPVAALAAAAGVPEAEAKAAIQTYEEDRTILGVSGHHRLGPGTQGECYGSNRGQGHPTDYQRF